MLVIISDLHLTDGSSGETIRTGAFRAFRERLRDLAYDASWRSDKKYEPIKEIHLVLLGDILDLIRSTRWCSAPETIRPWGQQDDPAFAAKIAEISDAVLANNRDSIAALKSLCDPRIMNIPPTGKDGRVATVSRDLGARERVPVNVKIYYMVGNHDWFYHLQLPALDAVRQRVIDAVGLANEPGKIFPHDPAESAAIQQALADHNVFARHGDIFDSSNFEHIRDASSLGDAIVIELLDRFPDEVEEQLGGKVPQSCISGLREIDNVRPLWIIPTWVDGLVKRTCNDEEARAVKAVWNELVDRFLAIDFVRQRPLASAGGLELAFRLSDVLSLDAIARVTAWYGARFGTHGQGFYQNAFGEAAFKDRAARFIVYGHTHHHEIVPLQSFQAGNDVVDQVYINSGTWRAVHELAQFHPSEREFVGYHVMTYLAFFKGDERKGRSFETWSGALDSSAA